MKHYFTKKIGYRTKLLTSLLGGKSSAGFFFRLILSGTFITKLARKKRFRFPVIFKTPRNPMAIPAVVVVIAVNMTTIQSLLTFCYCLICTIKIVRESYLKKTTLNQCTNNRKLLTNFIFLFSNPK